MPKRLYQLWDVQQYCRRGVGREGADCSLRGQRVGRVLPTEVRQGFHGRHSRPRHHVDQL
jgi:hypothetical protein